MEPDDQLLIKFGYLPPDCYSPVSDGSLQQGDLLFNFPSIRIDRDFDPTAGIQSPAKVELGDLIVLTQSCDLGIGKVDDILLCNHYDFEAVQEEEPKLSDWRSKEEIRRGFDIPTTSFTLAP